MFTLQGEFIGSVLCASLLCFCLPLAAQVPASTPSESEKPKAATAAPTAHQAAEPPRVEDSELGFSYSLPVDWKFVAPPPAPKVTVPFPDVVGPRKGNACVNVVLTAKRGMPASSVVVTDLAFSCYGETIAPDDLRDFGLAAEEGLKQTFKVTESVEGHYKLGVYTIWIERAKGAPKAHSGDAYTFETACTILTKGAVCWTAMAADAGSLQAFERTPVSLEGARFAALVPTNAFLRKP